MKTRTVIVSHSHPALKYGGGEVAAYRQYEYLRSLGEEAIFVGSALGAQESLQFLGPDQRVIALSDHDFIIRSQGMDAYYMDQSSHEMETWLATFLTAFKADIYHFHHVWNIGIGTIRRLRHLAPQAKFVFTLHEMTAICANHGQMVKANSNQLCNASSDLACAACLPHQAPIHHHLRRRRMIAFLESFDYLICPSRFLADRFQTWGIAKERLEVLENGLPFDRYTSRSDDEWFKSLSWRFAFFGQATPTKGLNVLVAAAKLLSGDVSTEDGKQPFDPLDSRLRIDIFGVERRDFERIWPKIEVPELVDFRGSYRPQDVIEIMAGYGWIVMPSIWWENSPVIIQEAKAAGTPMIISDIGGMKEKTENWGRHFQTGNAADLAQNIRQVAGNADVLKVAMAAVPQPFSMAEFHEHWSRIVSYGGKAAC